MKHNIVCMVPFPFRGFPATANLPAAAPRNGAHDAFGKQKGTARPQKNEAGRQAGSPRQPSAEDATTKQPHI